jgi:hypothetical protein
MEEKKINWGKIALSVISIAFAVFVLIQVLRIDRTVKDFLSDPFGLSRALDTVNIGTTANDGTGDPLRTAFIKLNRIIVMADSLDLDSLTNAEVQSLKDLEDLTGAVLFHVGDTTVTAAVGKVVFKTSNSKFYGCVRATPTTKWEAFN